MKDEIKQKRGKISRAQGNAFETRVREDLEEKGWIVNKWNNQIIDGKLVKAKSKWAGPGRPMMMGSGFPDFMAFRIDKFLDQCVTSNGFDTVAKDYKSNYEVIGVESKMTGELDREEKEKCKWLLDNNVFSKILIAEKTKVKNKVVIVYHDFKEKYYRFYQ